MKFRSSYIFYSFVILFAASVYYFDYYQGEQKQKVKDESAVVVPFTKDQINKIEIKRENDTLEFVKEDKDWKFTKPVNEPVDENAMSDWLNTILAEKSSETIGEGEAVQWVNYGLDKPKATLTIYKSAGDKVQIDLGTRKNFEGKSYLRKNQGSVVLVGSPSWAGHLEKSVRDLRDKKVLRSGMTQVETFKIIKAKDPITLKIKEGLWFSPEQEKWVLGQNSVREVVNALNDMRALEFISEKDPDKTEKLSYGLQAPSFSIELQFAGGKTWQADFGQGKDKSWFAWIKDLHKVYKIEASHVSKIEKAQLDGFRDRESAFIFKKDEVKKIIIQGNQNFEISKEGDKWKSAQPNINIDDPQVVNLLDRLHELRIGEFLDGKKTAPGLEQSHKKITLVDAQGKVIWSLIIGDTYKKKMENTEKQFYYAKTSISENIFH